MTIDELQLADGNYTVEVTMEGGSGRATIESPTALSVEAGSRSYQSVLQRHRRPELRRVERGRRGTVPDR